MKPVRILVDSFADAGLPNAQMGNAREIVSRLDPSRFHVSVFCTGTPDERIAGRPNTTLIRLPARRRSIGIFRALMSREHDIVFYLKSAPAEKLFIKIRKICGDRKVTIGTVESQSDLRNEPTVSAQAVEMWEKTVLCCDHLYSNSEAVRESLKKEYGLESQVIATGVDCNFFSPKHARPPHLRPQVFFAGSLRPFKQPQVLLAAATRFPHADFSLAGEGVMAPQLAQQIEQERLSNVRLLGMLTAEQLRNCYQSSDLFLFPSLWEGSPKVILEAASCGLPVIARNNYSPETVVDGQTGFLAASDLEIFERLEQLLNDPDLRRRLGVAGRKLAQRFDWDVITKQWENVFLALSPSRARSA